MKLKRLNSLVSVALLSLSAGSVFAQAKLSDNVIRIGVMSDMSGLYSDIGGPGSVEAVKMAADDFKKENPGFNIEVVSADHQNKADIAANKAREWFEAQKVDMITDNVNSATAIAVAKAAAQMNRVAIPNGAGSDRLTNEECTPNTIHYVYDTYATSYGTASAVVKQGGDSWFFLTADYAFGHSLEKNASDFVKGAGGKVLGTVRHPLNTSDFSSFLLQAQASKAKVIGLANAGGDTINSVKAANEFGITKGGQTLAGLLVFINDIHSLGLQTAQGMYVTEAFYWDMNDETRKWSERFFQKMKKMPSMVQAGNYSSTMHYLKAIKAAGTDEAGAVIKKMKELPVNDFFAKNGKIREDGRMIHEMYLFQVKKPAESKKPWDYYTLKATIPAAEAFQPLAKSRCPLIKK